MDNIIIIIYFLLYLIFFVSPISHFLHELGHAFGARLVKADNIMIIIGKGNTLVKKNVANLMIVVNKWYFIGGLTESFRDKPYHKVEKILILLLAPFLNGIIAIVFYIIFTRYSNIFVEIIIWYNLWLMLSNLLPFKWDGKQTDGYTIYKLMCK